MSDYNDSGSSFFQMVRSARDFNEVVTLFKESPGINRWLKRFPGLLTFVFILLALYAAALLTWQLMPKPDIGKPSVSTQVQTRLNPVKSALPRFSSQQIVAWSLFGKPENKNTASKVKKVIPVEKIKEAQLQVNLIGIIYSKHKEESRAIIMGGPKPPQEHNLYKVNDTIATNTKIVDIMKDQIILEHNNERVRVKLKSVKDTENFLKKYPLNINTLKKETANQNDTLR